MGLCVKGFSRYPLAFRRFQGDPSVLDYNKRVIAAGGSISAADLRAIDRFVKQCKTTAGLWDKIQDMSPLAGNSLTSALVKLKGAGALTGVNMVGGDYTRTGGIDPGALNSTKYLATGYLPSANATLTSFHAMFHSTTYSAAAASFEMGAVVSGTQEFQYFTRFSGDLTGFDTWEPSTGRCSTSAANGQGNFIASRIANNDAKFYRNASAIATAVTAAGTLPNVEVFILAANNAGVAGSHSPRPIGCYSLGLGLNGGEAVAYTGYVQQLMSAFGRAI